MVMARLNLVALLVCFVTTLATANPPPATNLALVDNHNLTVRVRTTNGLTALAAVYNNNGALIAWDTSPSFSEPAEIVLNDLAPGTYYIGLVTSDSPPTGSFGMPEESVSGIFFMFIGGDIHGIGGYTVSNSSVSWLRIYIRTPSTTNGNNPRVVPSVATLDLDTLGSGFNTIMSVYDSLGNRIASNDDGGSGYGGASRINDLSLIPGRYYIALSGSPGEHQTTRFMTLDGSTSQSGPFVLRMGGVQIGSGTLVNREVRFYEFLVRDYDPPTPIAEKASTLVPTFLRSPGTSTFRSLGVFDAQTGQHMGSITDQGPALNLNLPAGEYIAALASFAFFGDGFTVISFENGLAAGNSTFQFGNVTSLSNQNLPDPGAVLFYEFTVRSPEAFNRFAHSIQKPFTIRTDAICCPIVVTDTAMALWDESGNLLGTNDNSGPGIIISRIMIGDGLPAGVYYVAVAGGGGLFQGGAIFHDNFQVTNLDATITPFGPYVLKSMMASYPDVTRALEIPGEVDYYRFYVDDPIELSSTAGVDTQPILISSINATAESRWTIWNTEGDVLQSQSAAGDFVTTLAPGQYYLSIGPDNAIYSSQYRISDGVPGNSFLFITIGLNQFIYINIDANGVPSNEFFRIVIADADRIEDAADLGVIAPPGIVEINTQGSDFATSLSLWDEGGALLATDLVEGPGIPFSQIVMPLNTGAYYFAVAGSPNVASGPGFAMPIEMGESGTIAGAAASTPFSGEIEPHAYRFYRFEIGQAGCNLADIAPPFGILDLADIGLFVVAFTNQDPIADIAPPFGVFDLGDLGLFVGEFTAGCP